jgi:hypothetical protein
VRVNARVDTVRDTSSTSLHGEVSGIADGPHLLRARRPDKAGRAAAAEGKTRAFGERTRPAVSLKLPGMMKHLDVLSDAGLITRSKTGRTVSVNLSVRPKREAMEWLQRYEGLWTASMDRLVALVEKG